ncbi:MAG: heavy metal translocating P-type ATPase [Leptospiraceae bacterium]|nr:heavy metal translocating P-type ATPase [Leptospiraceae bacterium]
MLKNCYHCHNSLPKVNIVTGVINEVEREFCCNGCKSVAQLISNMGKDYFYSLRGNEKIDRVTQKPEYKNESLNSASVYKKFVKQNGNYSETFIQITNLYCSACVWLNEKVLLELPGVTVARVNFSTGRVFIVWDDTKIKLSNIFNRIAEIGYEPKLFTPSEQEKARNSNVNDLLLRMVVAAFGLGSLMAITASLYAGFFQGMEIGTKRIFHLLSWLVATPVYLYSGMPFLRSAFYSLKNKTLNMDFLLVIGISMAYFYSVYVTFTDKGEVYFDSVCMIYFLVLGGKYIEALARKATNDKINSLLAKIPESSIILKDGEELRISSDEIQVNDIVLIPAGERIPVDGTLISDSASVDESFLSGESNPIRKFKGDTIFCGSSNFDSLIKISCTKTGSESKLGNLKSIIEKSMNEKPNIERKTEKIAYYFIGVVFLISVFAFSRTLINGESLEAAIINTISVLIVACPCALGLAVPSTLVINSLVNARKGIIIKNLDIIEPLSKTDVILLDKTGTITEGKLNVVSCGIKNVPHVFPMIYTIEKMSNHPIAKTLYEFTKEFANSEEYRILEMKEIPGGGVEAKLINKIFQYSVFIGNRNYIEKNMKDVEYFPNSDLQFSGSIIHVVINNYYFGKFILNDVIRDGFKEEVKKLKDLVKDIRVISGDTLQVVQDTCKELDLMNYKSGMKPEDKIAVLDELQSQGHKVMMVGDGINDAATLAKANIGISHRNGMDMSIDKSDVILINNDLKGIRYSIEYSKLTSRKITENILISIAYNSIMLPLAAFGYMQPVYCAFFMSLSSLTVIANSFLLKISSEKIK